jgi:lipid A disaccharide synthetase
VIKIPNCSLNNLGAQHIIEAWVKVKNFYPQKINNSIEYLVENEENEHQIPDRNRMRLIMTNEPNDIHKQSKRELWMRSLK